MRWTEMLQEIRKMRFEEVYKGWTESLVFIFPLEEWISLETINIIERLNKEFRCRTNVMEVASGEIVIASRHTYL